MNHSSDKTSFPIKNYDKVINTFIPKQITQAQIDNKQRLHRKNVMKRKCLRNRLNFGSFFEIDCKDASAFFVILIDCAAPKRLAFLKLLIFNPFRQNGKKSKRCTRSYYNCKFCINFCINHQFLDWKMRTGRGTRTSMANSQFQRNPGFRFECNTPEFWTFEWQNST